MREERCGVRVRDKGEEVREERSVMWKDRKGSSVTERGNMDEI